jgi:hypothetical protein
MPQPAAGRWRVPYPRRSDGGHPREGSVLIENRRQSSRADEVIEGGAAAFITLLGVAVCGPPRRATARNVLRDLNSVPVLVEGKGGGFATSEEFLCHV